MIFTTHPLLYLPDNVDTGRAGIEAQRGLIFSAE
jgi:hypothetical protein